MGLAVGGKGSSVGSLVGGSDTAISDSKFSCLVCVKIGTQPVS